MYATAIEKKVTYFLPQFKTSRNETYFLKGRYSPKNSRRKFRWNYNNKKSNHRIREHCCRKNDYRRGCFSAPDKRYCIQNGIRTALADDATIALGSSEVVPLELAGAYSVFPNKGMYIAPNWYKKIVDRDNAELAPFNPSKWRAISEGISR